MKMDVLWRTLRTGIPDQKRWAMRPTPVWEASPPFTSALYSTA
jgi:hypothetical protein